MATQVSGPDWGRLTAQGFAGGIAGAILFDACQYVEQLATTPDASLMGTWQWVASSAVGSVAYTSTNYAWLGLLFQLIVSIAWATGFAYVAATRPNVLATPILSGLVFGVIVWLAMKIVLTFDHIVAPMTVASILLELLANCVFYGIPVALTVRAVAKRQP